MLQSVSISLTSINNHHFITQTMSIAFQTNSSSDTNRIQSLGFTHQMWIHNISDSGRFSGGGGGNHWSNRLPAVIEEEDSTSSSSIGKNSDGAGDNSDDGDGEGEVQSKDNTPINNLNDLEQVLPIKRGISTFYAGKSKSYGSLADAVAIPSIQDIVKPEDAYSRKRKNMIAHQVIMDKHRNSENGIYKRLARNIPDSNENVESRPGLSLPPLPRNAKRVSTNESLDSSPKMYSSPWRSLSLSDLQNASDATSSITGSVSKGKEKENGYDEYR